MGKRKDIIIDSTSNVGNNINHLDLDNPVSNSSTKNKKNGTKKKDLARLVKCEYNYISNLLDILELTKNHGKRGEEDDYNNMELLDVPEQNVSKKYGLKKGGTTQASSKSKSFPQTIEGLEKELEELKGSQMSYQKALRKKGLQSRLIKKKRKEEFKQRKLALKQGKKYAINGHGKLVKPVFNNDGHVVSNKFDFADSDAKKENKRKSFSETSISHGSEILNVVHISKKKSFNISNDSSLERTSTKESGEVKASESKTDKSNTISKGILKSNNSKVKTEKENAYSEPIIKAEENKNVTHQGPIFNKDNKMVFSKVLIPENNHRHKKKKEKDPKKILQKIKDNSKKISELEKEDKEKAISLQEKQKWTAALKRASGEKVKDDPELLKKSIAKEKNLKMRSKKKWQARIDRVHKDKEERQKKRTENIQARKNENKKRKMKKAIKKGSYVQV